MAVVMTPFGRMVRRRGFGRQVPYEFRDNEYAEPQCDVLVPVNVKAEDDAYIITALLPGVQPEDLNIQVVEETVTLQGEIKTEGETEKYLVNECPTGHYYRAVRLPAALDANKASADLTNGVLTLRVPKAEEARPRTIKVQSK